MWPGNLWALNNVEMHRTKKRLGQHFLHDQGVIQRIVADFRPLASDNVVEIGPGQGALTKYLLGKSKVLHAVELDRDLINQLETNYGPRGLTVHNQDALEFDFCQLVKAPEKIRVIGNLPYNISTPLIFHLLDQLNCIQDMSFLLQKEIVDRMGAEPNSKQYGRLSVMVQSRCQVVAGFKINPGAFSPPPKVTSRTIKLNPWAEPPAVIINHEVFASVVKQAFSQRRKTLRNSLKELASEDVFSKLGIDASKRAENLTLEEFAQLSNTIS